MTAAPFGFGAMPEGAYSGLRRSVIDPITGLPVVTSAPSGEVVHRSTILPVGRDDAGRLVPALPSLVTGAVEAAKFPGQVYRGETGVYDPVTGHVSEEAIGKAADIAGLAFTGSLPFKAPAGALRSFGGAAERGADDVLGSLEAALSKGIADNPQPPPTGPRRLDPNALSWDLYHGSTPGPDFRRFDPQVGSNPAERGAVFFAPNPETASGYASATAQGGEAGNRVFRAMVEPGRTKVFDLADMAETDPAFTARAREITAGQGGAGHGTLFDEYMTGFRASRAQDREIAGQLREMGYAPGDPSPVSYGWGHIGAAVERARAEGLDTAILRGLAEHGGDDQVIALTPGRVRSRYSGDLLYAGAPVGLGLGAAGLASPDAAQAAPSQGTPPVTASPFGFGPATMRPEDLARLFQTMPLGAPQGFAPIAESEADVQRLERSMGMVPASTPPRSVARPPLSFGAPQRAAAPAGSMTVPLPPQRPSEFQTSQADLPAEGAQAIMSAAQTAPPAAEGPSFLDRIGAGLRSNGDLLTSLGVGLMSTPGFGAGAAAGLQSYQQGEGRRAATKLAEAEYGLKARELQRKERGENSTRAFLLGKGLSAEQADAAMANPTVLSSTLSQINKDPSRVTIGGNIYELKPGERPSEANLLGPAEAERDQAKLVDVPIGNGQTQKVWLKPGEATGQNVGAPERSGSSNVSAQIEERRQGVIANGGDPNDPRNKDFILTGRLPKEDQQALTAADKNAIREGQDRSRSALTAVQQLRAARALSDKAYDGLTAQQRALVMSNVPGFLGGPDPAALDTREMQNLITTQALTGMKAIFGANPTEGERKALESMQGAADQPMDLRNKILDEAIRQAESRAQYEQERVDELRGGTYYRPETQGGPGAVQGPGAGYAPRQGAPRSQPSQTLAQGPLAAARDAISRGAPRDAVIKRLRDSGIDPAGL